MSIHDNLDRDAQRAYDAGVAAERARLTGSRPPQREVIEPVIPAAKTIGRTRRKPALTVAEWRAHLGVTGWHHEDGTACPTTLAPAKHERLWCTEHQQFVIAAETRWRLHRDSCPTCGLGRKQDGIWDDLCDVGRGLKDAAKAARDTAAALEGLTDA